MQKMLILFSLIFLHACPGDDQGVLTSGTDVGGSVPRSDSDIPGSTTTTSGGDTRTINRAPGKVLCEREFLLTYDDLISLTFYPTITSPSTALAEANEKISQIKDFRGKYSGIKCFKNEYA